ncbi:PepSY-associated TM helix domain-containing protein [Pseudoalteromonas tunicata]|jgi:uncharacterized iron-regulated membrane protein|uniref:Uncharacterized iron-regulated membrane protein n=1 Tax=Pseudoalteromonas tunicata D2 TaxID=87626 RepID=A4C3U6_9GAMM|nr:PepSY-associated TM helix domain-containing protein [Pseudoalteromonas tunicata]ATC96493.1 hypothetical protein PTUN_b0017 [Pseudoalteromonas tunicata]AXT33366.1 PepSY domain-containing protein [Pseudoalteromonas tunicata]EAR30228.1 putative uncharacterized iron-regulated membrane protein [Pseudoalteromonas tunicata D2]
MKESFFRSMTWLHTWVGLSVCWLLFLIFFAGTLSFFRHEITLWSQPAFHSIQAVQPDTQAQKQQLVFAIERLSKQAPDADNWRISLPNDRKPALELVTQAARTEGKGRGKRESHYFDPNTFDELSDYRQTAGGNFFYRLHFDLHYLDRKLARWLVGFASLFMLIALISGVVIHKRIFKDMFSFRRGKGSRTWLDGHNLSSVIALPFHLMITYTGIITLIFMYFPYPILSTFNGDFKAFSQELSATKIQYQRSHIKDELAPLEQILTQVQHTWPNTALDSVSVSYPFDQAATITFRASTLKTIRDEPPTLVFDANTAQLLAATPVKLSSSETIFDSMTALHTGRLAEPVLRWLYFFCGIAGCVMIASGCVMWAKRIRERMKANIKGSFGLKLVEALNVATIMGLPLATGVFLYANRLLPNATLARADQEILSFFITWLAVCMFACFKRDRAVWRNLALLIGVMFAGLPLLNSMVLEGNTWRYLNEKNWVLFSADFVCLVIAFASFMQYQKLSSPPARLVKNSSALKRGVTS